MGNGTYGQCGHRGQWGTGDMGHMDNDADSVKVIQGVWGAEVWGTWAMRPTGGMGYRGMDDMGNRSTGVWGTWGMGHMVNRSHGQWGTWAMGLMGHGTHGQWGPWAIGTFLPITPLILDGFLQKFYWR